MILLQVKNFGLLKEVELEIPENELTVFLGANFSGKSTAMLALQLATFGRAHYIENGTQARPAQLIRHGQNSIFTRISYPTFTSTYEHNNGAKRQEVIINGVKVDSDKNEEHEKALLKHIGADAFKDLSKAILRFFYLNPQSQNIWTILPSERKAYLLERWDYSRLQTELALATKKLNAGKDQIIVLEKVSIEGIEIDTKYLEEDINAQRELLQGRVHYSRIAELELGLERTNERLEQALEYSRSLETVFTAEKTHLAEHMGILRAQEQASLIDRETCKARSKEIALAIRLSNIKLDQYEEQAAKPLRCKKCGAEHYYDKDDIWIFDTAAVARLLSGLKTEMQALQEEQAYYNTQEAGWLIKDEIEKLQVEVGNLEKSQANRRENSEGNIKGLSDSVEVIKTQIAEAKGYEEAFRNVEQLEKELYTAKSQNEILTQARKQKAEHGRLVKSCEGLTYLTKKGIPEIIHEAIEIPLQSLVVEINRGLEAVEIGNLKVAFRLNRSESGFPSGIELPIFVDGYEMTYAGINSQGLARVLSLASLIGEFAAFGSPFNNTCGLTLFDDPLFGTFDYEERDLKSKLARAIGSFTGGTRIVATGDKDMVSLMRPARVYEFRIKNKETKVSLL